jgi:site-specific DNA-methyltransferase (adenine-specific)
MDASTAPDAHNLSSNACARCGLRVKANGSGQKCECGDLRETMKLPSARNGHPTVKPLALMRYLVKLTATPSGGVVLDPFAGSGTTGIACGHEGREFVGIEMDPHYTEIANARIAEARRNVLPKLEIEA